MSTEKQNLQGITSIRSHASHLDANDYEVDIQAVTSHPVSLGEVGGALTDDQKYFILKRLNFGGLLSLEDLPLTALFMIEKIESLTEKESVAILEKNIPLFSEDPNYPPYDMDLLERLVAQAPLHLEALLYKDKLSQSFKNTGLTEKENYLVSEVESVHTDESLEKEGLGERQYLHISDWGLQVRLEASLFEFWSPYPEVRAVSDPFDDHTIPCETLRVYIVGTIWCAIGAVINQFFSERQPSISLSSLVAQIFIYPSGVLLSYIFPKWKFKVWKYTIDLNPGPWTPKEQMLTTLFYAVSGGNPYSSYNILMQKLDHFYGEEWVTWGYQILLTLSTQFMGFGFAGVVRRFAVYPVHTVWPTYLPTLALNKALVTPEKKQNINGWTISRYSFFFITFAASFLYFWVPTYLFQALSLFNWMAWIKPDNFNLATITGSQSGLGLNPIPSFDWTVISTAGFSTPFYSTVNMYIGVVLGFFCIVGVYYTNYKWTSYLPINSNSLFTNTGEYYNVRSVVNEQSLFDEEKYKQVGPPFYSAANLVTYGAFFALYPFAFLYEILTNYRAMWASVKSLLKGLRNFHRSGYEDFDDPHCRMMSKYPEVPEWVFTIVMIISLVLAILTIKLYPTETPVWAIFFAIGLNFIFIIPMVTLASVTGFTYALNVLVELIIGYAIPGNGLALSIIKSYGTMLDSQTENYITNQKYAHYSRIPPRSMFRVQILSIFVNTFICLAILNFQITSFKNYCLPHQAQKFTCPGTTTFYSASVIWGVIGPRRVFDGLYPILKYCFLIGFLLAPICAAAKIFGPKKYMRYFQPSVIIGGMLNYAPYNMSYYTGTLYTGIASMLYLKKRYPAFWEKYNYLFGAGIGSGIAFSGIILFFAVQYHPKVISWWGNDVNSYGLDYAGISRLNATELAPDGYFGPRVGHFP